MGAQPDIVKLEWQPCQLLYGPQMGFGNGALKNMHIYVGIFLYDVKYEQLDNANIFFSFWSVDNK